MRYVLVVILSVILTQPARATVDFQLTSAMARWSGVNDHLLRTAVWRLDGVAGDGAGLTLQQVNNVRSNSPNPFAVDFAVLGQGAPIPTDDLSRYVPITVPLFTRGDFGHLVVAGTPIANAIIKGTFEISGPGPVVSPIAPIRLPNSTFLYQIGEVPDIAVDFRVNFEIFLPGELEPAYRLTGDGVGTATAYFGTLAPPNDSITQYESTYALEVNPVPEPGSIAVWGLLAIIGAASGVKKYFHRSPRN